ncbi:alpha/beta fold hydrolase [Streptomyces sp. SID3343]|nr:alpha/beta fold hydrolase [Streptomyces sp. SID3343]
MTTRTVHLRPDLPITISEAADESREAPAALVLHGGGGPGTVAGIAEHLAESRHVIAPTHPGWDGTERPAALGTVGDLASVYLRLLADEGHRRVVLVGSSLGGWIAAEMALRDESGIVAGIVLIDAVGVDIPEHPIRDFFALDARGVAEYSYFDPDRFRVDPSTVPPAQLAARAANIAALRAIAGDPYMHDPTLLGRLGDIRVPALVVWGDSDRIVTPSYGRRLAATLPDAHFALVARAGHLPHLERPEATYAELDAFAALK